jgi:hypothetical protein
MEHPSKYDVTTKMLQNARRFAQRTRATAACDRCKALKSKCSGFVPCARCTGSSRACIFSTNLQPTSSPQQPDSGQLNDFATASDSIRYFRDQRSKQLMINPEVVANPFFSGIFDGSSVSSTGENHSPTSSRRMEAAKTRQTAPNDTMRIPVFVLDEPTSPNLVPSALSEGPWTHPDKHQQIDYAMLRSSAVNFHPPAQSDRPFRNNLKTSEDRHHPFLAPSHLRRSAAQRWVPSSPTPETIHADREAASRNERMAILDAPSGAALHAPNAPHAAAAHGQAAAAAAAGWILPPRAWIELAPADGVDEC